MTKRVSANRVSSPFARIVDGVAIDYDPLRELGRKDCILNPHRDRPLGSHKLVDSRLRIPAWREAPLDIRHCL